MRPLLFLLATALFAQSPDTARSVRLKADLPLSVDADSDLWKSVPGVVAEAGPTGEPSPGHRTEIRSRWTPQFLYFLFICDYKDLYGNANPSKTTETAKLWEHDVAEVFVGGDSDNIWRYREYQVSPQGEWVDLDIDRKNPLPEGGWRWNSGFEVAAKIDPAKKIWYGAMKIPIASINTPPVKAGSKLRANFYRLHGPPPNRVFVAWRPTGQKNYHVPEAFGVLELVD